MTYLRELAADPTAVAVGWVTGVALVGLALTFVGERKK